MHILVLPVSGNFFPAQLSLLSELISVNYDPGIILGTSGGAVSSILSLGADWSVNGIRRLAKQLKPSLFLSNWWPNSLSFLPSWSLGYFRGSVYNAGFDSQEFFKKYMTSELLTQKEVWIGVSNQSKDRAQFFCNLSEEDSMIDVKCFESHVKIGKNSHCDHLKFAGGDLHLIRKATIASASIPTLVPPQEIEGDSFSDGGLFYASPLTPLRDCLEELEDSEGLHITYVNTYDIEDQKIGSSVDFYPGIFRTGAIAFATMVFSILSQDRVNGLKMLNEDIGELNRVTLKGNKTVLKSILDFRKKVKRSFLELYTTSNSNIDLTDFTSDDILEVMDKTKEEYYCRFWWVGDNQFIISL